MSFYKPQFRHPELPQNALGYTLKAYEGGISTLCAGCGHDSISAAIMQAVWKSDIDPQHIIKLSGIGCSSKTPAYFLGRSHGFNTVHGRMPSVATGAIAANKDLVYIGVSGDGDTASIGIGQYLHAIRRNLNMVYIVENNGCYGLTKGQDSATADVHSKNKKGMGSDYDGIDLVGLALSMGAGFVARSFSGDKAQLVPLIQAAIAHKGFAFIDVISPCVTFNNQAGSSKSYDYVREHVATAMVADYVPHREAITVDYDDNLVLPLHNGELIALQKNNLDYEPTDRVQAMTIAMQHYQQQKILTGLIYIDKEQLELHEKMNTVDVSLNSLRQVELCPNADQLARINASLR